MNYTSKEVKNAQRSGDLFGDLERFLTLGYHYDQIYPYQMILQEVKELILPTVIEMVNPEDLKNIPLRKEDLADIYYSHIMALAYNGNDINATLDDLMV